MFPASAQVPKLMELSSQISCIHPPHHSCHQASSLPDSWSCLLMAPHPLFLASPWIHVGATALILPFLQWPLLNLYDMLNKKQTLYRGIQGGLGDLVPAIHRGWGHFGIVFFPPMGRHLPPPWLLVGSLPTTLSTLTISAYLLFKTKLRCFLCSYAVQKPEVVLLSWNLQGTQFVPLLYHGSHSALQFTYLYIQLWCMVISNGGAKMPPHLTTPAPFLWLSCCRHINTGWLNQGYRFK